MAEIIQLIFLLFIAWLPVDLGIQALHQYQAGKMWSCVVLITVGIITNAIFIILIDVT